MTDFKNYLIKTGILSKNNINRMNILAETYITWLKTKNLSFEEADYKQLMNFIGYMQKENKSKHHINRTLQSISHYYRFKKLPDTAQTTRLRGITRTQPQNLLPDKELDNIYESFEAKHGKGYYYHSDKLILGLIIYQALDMKEFLNIETGHLQLEKGKIYTGEHRNKQSRVIPLKAKQILSLNDFVKHTRLEIIKKYAEKDYQDSDRLFAPQADNYNKLHYQFKQLSIKVKQQAKEKLNIEIYKLCQLRHSRIALWTEEHGLLQTKYLAGFKRVSSVERYKQANLKDLKEQIEKYHPLK